MFGDPRLPGRFWDKVQPEPMSGCWLWTAASLGGGRYGCIGWKGRVRPSHRVAYEQLVSPIPAGLECDHLCRTTLCVNPDHIEPVTHAENVRRGHLGKAAREATHCKHGHPFDVENTGVNKAGKRFCRTCSRRRSRDHYWADVERSRAMGRARDSRRSRRGK